MNEFPNPPPIQGFPISTDPHAAHGNRAIASPYISQATTILILGIAGLVLFPPAGIPAWIMGSQLRKEANAAGYPEPGQSRAGRICGVIATIITVALVVGMVLFMANRTNRISRP